MRPLGAQYKHVDIKKKKKKKEVKQRCCGATDLDGHVAMSATVISCCAPILYLHRLQSFNHRRLN